MAVYEGMVRPSLSPGEYVVVTNPGTKLYLCPAQGTAKDRIRRQVEEYLQFCALPLENIFQPIGWCPRASPSGDARKRRSEMRRRQMWLVLFCAVILITVHHYAGNAWATPANGGYKSAPLCPLCMGTF